TNSGYIWFRNNVKLNNDTLVSLKIKLNGTYGLKVKNQEGCQSIQTEKTVSYLPLPAISTTTTTMTICSGDSARLFATSDSTTGRTYTWYRNNIIENNWDTIGSCWIKNAGFYKVTVTNLAGCKRSKDIGTLTVNSRPNVIFNAIPSNSFCSNDSIRLNLYYTQGNSHVWYRNNQFFNGSSTLITVKDSASYYVVVTGNANCRTTTNVITTNKIPLPNTTFTITPNDSFCSGDSTKLSAFDQPNNQYKWYRNNMELTGQTAGELWTKQPGLYKLYVRNGSCNATSTPLTISMFNKPNTPIINVQPNNFFCVGDSTLLSTNIQTGFQYKWYLNDVELAEKISNDMWATSGGNYQVKVSNVFCSSTSQTANITEAPLPEKPTITRISDTLYSSYTQNNNWYFNGILVASNQNYFKPTQNGIYTIEAVTNEGCKSDTANFNWTSTGLNTYSTLNRVTIYPNPSKGKVYIETAEEYRVSIFNQLGQLVYNGVLLPDITIKINLNQSAGVYIINLSSQKSTYTTKLVITD
ncbi:MAG: T9SS type A sorting domain-containing protein, partial [Bacteroidia bacterium]|nr:T9SS type A sorting domain-containing protein [Bacteroidia bacterium]